MKRMSIMVMVFAILLLVFPTIHSLDFVQKGFYAEYRIAEDPRIPHSSSFILLRGYETLDTKFLDLENLVYKYQVLDIEGNTAIVRVCFEGRVYAGGYDDRRHIVLPFKRIFDIKVDLNILEMVDENGNAWGKWLFWIKPASYNKKEYTVMKNWNDHGEVKGVLKGPLEYENLSSILMSSHAENLTHCFCLQTHKRGGDVWIYPLFEDYGIAPSYKAHKTEEGTVKLTSGSYYLGGSTSVNDKGEVIELKPGYFSDFFCTDNGIFLEGIGYYMDDFIDQKVGIVVLQLGGPLVLTDYGVSDDILIEDPTPESQRTSFLEEVRILEGKSSEDVPQETKAPEPPQEKSETPAPTTTQPNNTEETNILYYIAPILVVAFIAVFLVLKEKR